MPLPIFTIQTFNQNTLQPAGAVFAQRVEMITAGRDFLGGITGSTGGRNTAIEKKMHDLTKSLVEELHLQANRAFPSAVALVDVKMHISNDSPELLTGQASATALVKRNKLPTPQPSPVTSGEVSAPMASPLPAPMASPLPAPMASPMASPMAAPMASPVAVKNNTRNSRILNAPVNPVLANRSNRVNPGISANSAIPMKIGGKKNFISKSRKNRI
jgi:uncharacterized protein YbjQ (UPF0145 family)